MLQFYQSNDLSALTNAFCERSNLTGTDPFTPSTVIVQSYGTGQWLKLQLANNIGIAANLDCVLPANFIWGMYQKLLDQPAQSPMDKDLLTWRIMSILPSQDSAEFQPIRTYLNVPGDKDLRTFQLAGKIAGLFDQYLVYRPEWLLAWEEANGSLLRTAEGSSTPHPWQPLLWRALMQAYPGLKEQHRARLHQRLLVQLEKAETPDLLPTRLSLFGLSSLPVMQLDTFRALSNCMDVDIYFMNPCCHYWGDIVSKKDQAKRSIRALIGKTGPLVEDDYLEVGNPLLASMGRQGREFLELILETEGVNSFDAYVETPGDTALGFLQNDILHLEFGGQFGNPSIEHRIPVQEDDQSIQVHSCHSKLREVEILNDQLLQIFLSNPGLKSADVIVMAPDIAQYTPFIHAVFRNKIPYGIADRSLLQHSSLIGSFFKLLDLPDARLTSTEVMDFLEVPAIARKFNLEEDELNTISYWIHDARIRWEMDGQSKSERWQVPGSHQNTWRFGLDRLLLGMAMDSDDGIFSGDLPFNVESGDSELLGTLCTAVAQLDGIRKKLSTAQSASQWQLTINTALAELFVPVDEESLDLSLIQALMQKLVDDTKSSDCMGALSGQLVRYWIKQQLAATQSAVGFITGGITFATLIPMRSIPFKVVCLLGMNDRQYPREDRPVSFDLMSIDGARKGDRSGRADDRYLFLEAMLSARDIFYVSYEGRALKDNQPKPPSVVVSELLDYTSQVFESIHVTHHPLQPFSRRYFDGSQLTSFQQVWYTALQQQGSAIPFIDQELEVPEELALESLQQLTGFFRHSVKYFMQHRLGIYFDSDEIELQESESFTLDNLDQYQLSDKALQALLRGDDIQQWQLEMVASGFVMEGPNGKAYMDRELQHAHNICSSLQPYVTRASGDYHGNVSLSGVTIQGHLGNLGETFALNYQCGELRQRHLLALWIRHLFANACGLEIDTISISRDKDNVATGLLTYIDQGEAITHLETLTALYHRGLSTPLCLPPEATFSFMQQLQKSGDPASARDAATRKWNAGDFSEGNDIYWSRIFSLPEALDDNFLENATHVYAPLLSCWEEHAE